MADVIRDLLRNISSMLAAQPADVFTEIREETKIRLDPYRTEGGYEIPGLSFVGSGRH